MMVLPLNGNTGTSRVRAPVAMRICGASSVLTLPSAARTSTLPEPGILASPVTHSILFFLNRNAIPAESRSLI